MATPGDSFKTPLRTPARGEQTSTTPITPFEVIETHKENVQPLSRGRSAHALSTTLGMQHKERLAVLAAQREAHEHAVSDANADSDDPLDAWCAYVKWCIDSFPSGHSPASGLVPLLERATRTFHGSEQYRSDSRYLRLWVLYAQHVDCPRDVFNFLLANEVGTRLASLYEELARVDEEAGALDHADETFRLGIARGATPLERIKRRYAEFQQRVVGASGSAQPYSRALAEAMARAGRSVLGVKSGETSAPANVVRARGGNPGVASTRSSNARTLRVYSDENDTDPAPAPAPPAQWADLGSAEHRRQENASTLGRHNMRPMHAHTPGRTPGRVLEVFCDSDEDEPRRSPQKNDVFSKGQSESDLLRKNPFLHWAELPPAPPPERPKAAARAPARPTLSRKSRPERHAVPLAALYPRLDIGAVLDKARALPPTDERCLEEVLAERRGIPTSADAWTHLDAAVGQWLPERRPRAASPTLVTRAAIAEVDNMFNGEESESKSESDSEPESDADNSGSFPATPAPARSDENMDENAAQTPRVRTPFGQAPRTPLSARVEPPHARPFQPLTPITEATEVTRTRTRTPFARVDRGALRVPPEELRLPNPCSPADPEVVAALLANLAVPLHEERGYIDLSATSSSLLAEARAHARTSRRTSGPLHTLVVGDTPFELQHLLGEGGFGAVFLAEDIEGHVPLAGGAALDVDEDDYDALERARLVALKIESPPNPWEFYVLSALRKRLADEQARASIVGAREFVALHTESVLMLEYGAKGTLLDLVNAAGPAGIAAAGAGGVDEVLALFYAVELLRTVAAMHAAGVIHGDLKIDNCLVRLDGEDEWTSAYAADGAGGWASKGVQLIDFGRAIDLACFPREQAFVCDWTPGAQDCPAMHEARPWRHDADYYGIASIVYCLLFGQYMTTVVHDGRLRIQQPLRRYWQTELWSTLFDALLNPPADGVDLGALHRSMAAWLEVNSCRGGRVRLCANRTSRGCSRRSRSGRSSASRRAAQVVLAAHLAQAREHARECKELLIAAEDRRAADVVHRELEVVHERTHLRGRRRRITALAAEHLEYVHLRRAQQARLALVGCIDECNEAPREAAHVEVHVRDRLDKDRVVRRAQRNVVGCTACVTAQLLKREARNTRHTRGHRQLAPPHLDGRRRRRAPVRVALPRGLELAAALGRRAQEVHALLLPRHAPVVCARVEVRDDVLRLEQLDARNEARALDAVLVQLVRGTVRRHHDDDAELHEALEHAAQDHRVCNVSHLELVKAQHLRLARNLADDRLDRVNLGPVVRGTEACIAAHRRTPDDPRRTVVLALVPVRHFMHVNHELVEVHAALALHARRQRAVEQVHQHALARADLAVQVQTRRHALGSDHCMLCRRLRKVRHHTPNHVRDDHLVQLTLLLVRGREYVAQAAQDAFGCRCIHQAFLGLGHCRLRVRLELRVQLVKQADDPPLERIVAQLARSREARICGARAERGTRIGARTRGRGRSRPRSRRRMGLRSLRGSLCGRLATPLRQCAHGHSRRPPRSEGTYGTGCAGTQHGINNYDARVSPVGASERGARRRRAARAHAPPRACAGGRTHAHATRCAPPRRGGVPRAAPRVQTATRARGVAGAHPPRARACRVRAHERCICTCRACRVGGAARDARRSGECRYQHGGRRDCRMVERRVRIDYVEGARRARPCAACRRGGDGDVCAVCAHAGTRALTCRLRRPRAAQRELGPRPPRCRHSGAQT